MVSLVNPKFGDKIYDPCCGTGGFLIEAFRHIRKNCNITEKNLQILEKETIWGGELTETAKIAKMNMILAGDGHTHIKQQDSLAFPIKAKDKNKQQGSLVSPIKEGEEGEEGEEDLILS
jgi:type I restriction enzyme M protein